MTEVHLQLKKQFEDYLAENEKFEVKGVSAAGSRARKALGEIAKLVRSRRKEIQEAKNARKLAKQ